MEGRLSARCGWRFGVGRPRFCPDAARGRKQSNGSRLIGGSSVGKGGAVPCARCILTRSLWGVSCRFRDKNRMYLCPMVWPVRLLFTDVKNLHKKLRSERFPEQQMPRMQAIWLGCARWEFLDRGQYLFDREWIYGTAAVVVLVVCLVLRHPLHFVVCLAQRFCVNVAVSLIWTCYSGCIVPRSHCLPSPLWDC